MKIINVTYDCINNDGIEGETCTDIAVSESNLDIIERYIIPNGYFIRGLDILSSNLMNDLYVYLTTLEKLKGRKACIWAIKHIKLTDKRYPGED